MAYKVRVDFDGPDKATGEIVKQHIISNKIKFLKLDKGEVLTNDILNDFISHNDSLILNGEYYNETKVPVEYIDSFKILKG